jgi:hypothetical protein
MFLFRLTVVLIVLIAGGVADTWACGNPVAATVKPLD